MTSRMHPGIHWLPLAALLVLLVTSAVLGRGVVPSADAAVVVPVTGSIDADIFIDLTDCRPAAVDLGDLVPGIDPWKTARDEGREACSVDFGTTNYSPGTTLSMLEDPAAPATPAAAMKCTTGGCAGTAIADYGNVAAEPAAGSSAFGAQLLSNTGIATSVWNAAPAVYEVADQASAACVTGAVGTGTCDFTWGATADASTLSGSYRAQVRMVVLGN